MISRILEDESVRHGGRTQRVSSLFVLEDDEFDTVGQALALDGLPREKKVR